MKKLIILVFIAINLSGSALDIKSQKFSPSKIVVVQLGDVSSQDYKTVTSAFLNDLEFSGQFAPTVVNLETVPTVTSFKKWFQDGFGFSVFISRQGDKKYKVRVYDNSDHSMLLGSKIETNGDVTSTFVGHKISDAIFPVLTGKKSAYSSLIAACKRVKVGSKKQAYHIYVFYPSEFSKKVKVVNFNTLNIAPRWSFKNPILYYSQHTPTNVRLVSLNPWGKNSVVSNFDGLNMTPAFSKEGSVVVSLTKNGHGVLCKYTYDNSRSKGVYRALTDPKIHAISPSFIDENRIVFCIIKDMRPRIAILDLKSGVIKQITENFSTSPAYNAEKNLVAYCSKVEGCSQVFIYDLNKHTHKQLTFDKASKDECNWSACGNFVIFAKEIADKNQICALSLASGQIKEITPKDEDWVYSSWSPAYDSCFLNA